MNIFWPIFVDAYEHLNIFYPQMRVLKACANTCNVEDSLSQFATQQSPKFVLSQTQHKKIALCDLSMQEDPCFPPH